MKIRKRTIAIFVLLAAILFLVFLPLYAGTSSYPLTIVSGNSMYPNLQNGDLVFYKATNTAHITNGTIIVFVQSGTGNSLLDELIRPVLIHRVVGEEVSGNGTISFETKGDNNDANDPFTTSSRDVLGVPVIVVPKLGLLFLFLQSPQGLIAMVGIITLGYLGFYDNKQKEEKKKQKLLGALARKALNGQISSEQFKELEMTLKYLDEFEKVSLKDSGLKIFVDWLKKGSLDEDWKITSTFCRKCHKAAITLETEENAIEICSHCNEVRSQNKIAPLNVTVLDSLVLESVDEMLSCLGKASKKMIYDFIKQEYGIRKEEIPARLDDFSFAVEKVFGNEAGTLDKMFVKRFERKIRDYNPKTTKRKSFTDLVSSIKEILCESDKKEQTNCSVLTNESKMRAT